MKNSLRAGVALLVLALAACQSQRGPAQAALQSARDAFDLLALDARQYAPEDAQAIDAGLAAATESATKGKFKDVLVQTDSLNARITALASMISAKKAELAAAWPALNEAMPKLLAGLKTQVDRLGPGRRVPAGLNAAAIDAGRTGLDAATQLWTEATTAAQGNDLATAATKGTEAKTKLLEAMKSLNMKLPQGI